jgi:hypothetical protein
LFQLIQIDGGGEALMELVTVGQQVGWMQLFYS